MGAEEREKRVKAASLDLIGRGQFPTLAALAEAARERAIRMVHVSTDEVYGEVMTGLSREDDAFRRAAPNAPRKPGATSWCRPTPRPTAWTS